MSLTGQAVEVAPSALALSPKLIELHQLASEQEGSSKAPSTVAAYCTDWANFENWCATHSMSSMPASVEALRLYIAEQATARRPSTIYRRLTAIKLAHQIAGYPSPTGHPRVTTQMEGAIRSDALRRSEEGLPAHRQVKPATIEVMRCMVATLDRTTVIGKRDAALLLGFAGGFRRSELVALKLGDLDWSDVDSGVKVTVRRSKMDQEGKGLVKPILRGGQRDTFPVRGLDDWLAATDSWTAPSTTPLFRSVNRHRQVGTVHMTPLSVAHIVKRTAELAGLDATDFAGHSLRRGMATTAARNGAHDRHIARLGGWKDGSQVLARYIDDGRSWNDTASGKLGL